MKRKQIINLLAVLFLLVASVNRIYSQTPESYVIFTFRDTYKITTHAPRDYFWIINQDSINSYNLNLSYLFLDFSLQNLDSCCNNVDVDPVLVFTNSKYEIDTLHSNDLKTLKNLILRKRKKIQEIKKTWTSGQKETTTIYATVIEGIFCSSNYHPIGQMRTGYKGKVYMPFSSFNYQSDFWHSANAKFILHSDFSKVKFDAINR